MFTGSQGGEQNRAREIGARGEARAAWFLSRRRGYQVLVRNWRSPRDQRDEIDLICRDGEVIVFVEVKTRATHAAVSGYHAIDHRKKRALLRAADAFLRALPRPRPRTFRFDVVELRSVPKPGDTDLHHFENVPLFPKYYFP